VATILVLPLVAFWAVLVWGKAMRPPAYPLPNGYRLAQIHSGEVYITTPLGLTPKVPGDLAVTTNVTDLAFTSDLVYGHLQLADRTEPFQHYGMDKPAESGYFILNTRDFTLQTGMSKHEWVNNLAELGIDEQPTLKEASHLFAGN